jgi:hypothetical protein
MILDSFGSVAVRDAEKVFSGIEIDGDDARPRWFEDAEAFDSSPP